jgi:hypothetical protein
MVEIGIVIGALVAYVVVHASIVIALRFVRGMKAAHARGDWSL